VRFEPTPPDRQTSAPGYTDLSVTRPDLPSEPTATASGQPTAPTQRPDPGGDATASSGSGDDGIPAWLVPILVLAGVAVLVGLGLLGLRALRGRRTTRRWHTLDPAEAAWAELHDTAVDLGFPWPSGKSPRTAAELLARRFAAVVDDADQPLRPMLGREANPEATDALDRVVLAVELARYSAEASSGTSVEQMQADAGTCVAAMRAGARPAVRRRADWLPRSVLTGHRAVVPEDAATRVRSDQDVVDHVG
jgi:hypothetical protein